MTMQIVIHKNIYEWDFWAFGGLWRQVVVRNPMWGSLLSSPSLWCSRGDE